MKAILQSQLVRVTIVLCLCFVHSKVRHSTKPSSSSTSFYNQHPPKNQNQKKIPAFFSPDRIQKIVDLEEYRIPSWVKEQQQPSPPSEEDTDRIFSSATTSPPAYPLPPPCLSDSSQFGYINGLLSATQTFYNCLLNITDPMSLPCLWNATLHGIVPIYTSIQLNNLHEVDAIAGTVTLDFYLRLYWQDNRFAMPEFWKVASPELQSNGFDITPFFTIGNSSIQTFFPDIRFHDVSDLDYIVETIRLNASNVFFWSRHTVATFMQPKMQFTDYPADSQIINIRYGSYAFDQTVLVMAFTPSAPITFNTNYDGSYTFQSNPEWEYDGSMTSYQTYVSGSGFLNAIFHIGIVRKGSGIVLRLILPIALLCFLGGLTFWAAYEGRVDSTITLLLAVSALYIVILANIPLVGYLTSMDTFIFWMFLLLCFSVVLHQIFAVMQNDLDTWPLRIFFGCLVQALGRISIFPLVTFFFLTTIGDINPVIQISLIIITAAIGSFVILKEFTSLFSAYKESVKLLLSKLNSEELLLKELSSLELLFVNRLEFHRWSISAVFVSEYLEKVGGLDVPRSKSVPLRRYSELKNPRHLNNKKPLPYDDDEQNGDSGGGGVVDRRGNSRGNSGTGNATSYSLISKEPANEMEFREENPQRINMNNEEKNPSSHRRTSGTISQSEEQSYRDSIEKKRVGRTRNGTVISQRTEGERGATTTDDNSETTKYYY